MLVGCLLAITSACTTTRTISVATLEPNLPASTHDYIRVDESIGIHQEIHAYILPYTAKLEEEMSRPLTQNPVALPIGQPESPLGNLVADLIRLHTRETVGHHVDLALINWRGLRITLPQGTITVGTVYELMPFENYFTVLRYSGDQMTRLFEEIAAYGGEPYSGARMTLRNRQPVDLLINGEPIDPSRMYWLVTNNWLADGGGEMPTLWDYLERIDTGVLIREALIDELSRIDLIHGGLDGRWEELP
ncbi:MAG TPA: 5'-nucleotidase C-terminal domain-containing protein [Kiritimatiellia bacterium]|nr:5'-nucleotidase C-terminal domain-containing protein [Kiritimatiellia bacterium]